MRILQPADWSKPRGFSHGVEFNGPGRWIVLAGQTGGDEAGNYADDFGAQVRSALQRIIRLLKEAGFRIREVRPISLRPDGRLRAPWWLGRLRAYGYLLAAEKP